MKYDYMCSNKKCKHEWIQEQRITDVRLSICPECEEETAVRLISGGTGFQLKGGGWAKEGYK